jgi:putative ABC transport system substrate-binding protein
MMRRRDLLLLGAAAAAVGWPAGAQEALKSAHIGFIVTGEAYPRRGFDEAMRRLGWIEGRNLVVERRMTGEDPERRKAAAAELIAANPDVIVAAGMVDALPVHALTRTIPIVVIGGSDIVEEGLAASLARPGGNVTGIVVLRGELDSKRLELLRELVPTRDAGVVSDLCTPAEKRCSRERSRGSGAPARAAGRREAGKRGGRTGRRFCRLRS